MNETTANDDYYLQLIENGGSENILSATILMTKFVSFSKTFYFCKELWYNI